MKNRIVAWIAGSTLLLLTLLAPLRAAGTEYFVAPDGDDEDPGTLAEPFASVQHCAQIAGPGDTCTLRGGTYYEVVRPAASGTAGAPITFRNYPGEVATLSGAEAVTGWQPHSGTIYRAPMPWTFNARTPDQNSNDQVFVDGQMLPEARWPNIPYDKVTRVECQNMARADDAAVTDSRHATFFDADLAAVPAGTYDGAKITFAPGYKMIHTTCDVSQQTTAAVSFVCNPDPGAWGEVNNLTGAFVQPSPGNDYTLWGTLDALDAPGEWFHAADGTLYLWLPGGGNPNGHSVEARRQPWLLDLRGREYIVVDGLDFFAGTIRQDANTHYTTIQNVTLRYPWHIQELLPTYHSNGTQALAILGTHNVVRDSQLAHTPSTMILLGGSQNSALNNVIYEAGYVGTGAAIAGYVYNQPNPGGAESNTARQNTVFDVGRIGIDADPGLDITYNDLYRSHLLISDMGTIYGSGSDGYGATIAYNLVHDNDAELDAALNYWGGRGIYLDDDTYNYWIYRNVVWNTTSPGIYMMGTNGTVVDGYGPGDPSNRRIYNNTVLGKIGARAKPDYNGLPQSLNGVEFKNNLATKLNLKDPALDLANNYEGDGLFVDAEAHDYHLLPYSPAVDAGLDLGSPAMDPPMEPIGLPDIGALEQGRLSFVAGAVLRPGDLAGLEVTCVQMAGGDVTCTVGNLPLGRKLPLDFQIRLGLTGTPTQPGDCLTQMDYDSSLGVGLCAPVPAGGLSGLQPIFLRLGDGEWLDSGYSVELGALAVTAVSPGQGSIWGGTRVTLQGRRFATGVAGYARPITVSNPSGVALYSYPVPVELDSAAAIAAGKMRGDCGDLRFSSAHSDLPYWIEAGCNSSTTRVWVKAAYIPPGNSTFTVTYGHGNLLPASDGRETFVFYDDFEDGLVDETYWQITDAAWFTIEESGGAMRIYGATDTNTRYTPADFYLETWRLPTPPTFAIDAELSSSASSPVFKANLGSNDLALYDGGSGVNKKIGYYDGNWQQVGTSTVNTSLLSRQYFSIGYSGEEGNWTVRWLENGDLADVRAERVVSSASYGGFGYSPDTITPFDVQFDNVRLRNYHYPEPAISLGAERHVGLTVTFDGLACTSVAVQDPGQATCRTPLHPLGAVDVVVINPDGSQATLAGGYVYVETERLHLPLVFRASP